MTGGEVRASEVLARLSGGVVVARERMKFEVWAPHADRRASSCCWAASASCDDRWRTAAGGGPMSDAAPDSLVRVSRVDGGDPSPDPAGDCGSRRGPEGPSQLFDVRSRRLDRRSLAGSAAARRGDLRAARGHVHPRGHTRRRHRAPRPSRRPRESTWSR
ncbi:MAG: hypothetical protein WKF73_12185 [Nocardioidaceae bacterium]